MKKLFSIIFTFVLGGISIYFFEIENFIVAVLLLIWTLSRLFGYNLQRLVKGLGEMATHSDLEKKANIVLETRVNIEEVLNHKAVDRLFKKLEGDSSGKISVANLKKQIVENYKKKFTQEDPIDTVRFNIKNNILWKNGEIDFNDLLFHEIYVPYKYDETKGDEELIFTPNIGVGLHIRVLVVNGMLKLQIGSFSKDLSQDVVKKGLDVYKTHETITEFPLMYFSYHHKIPEKYLGLSMYATDSYYSFLKNGGKDFTKDWKELNQEVRDYNYVCAIADEYIEDANKWGKLVNQFDEKKNKILEKEGFKDPFARDDDDDYYDNLRSDNIHFDNKYMSIFVINHTSTQDKREKYLLTDYYEERP
ncbi:MAG: hypothetical protein Q8R30_05055 [bacterium]|nr:hypothetical protein [bacterium]